MGYSRQSHDTIQLLCNLTYLLNLKLVYSDFADTRLALASGFGLLVMNLKLCVHVPVTSFLHFQERCKLI